MLALPQKQQVRERRRIAQHKLAQAIRLPEGSELAEPVVCQEQRPATPQPAILLAMLVEVEGPPPAVPAAEHKEHFCPPHDEEGGRSLMSRPGVAAALFITAGAAAVGRGAHELAAEETHCWLQPHLTADLARLAHAVVVQLNLLRWQAHEW